MGAVEGAGQDQEVPPLVQHRGKRVDGQLELARLSLQQLSLALPVGRQQPSPVKQLQTGTVDLLQEQRTE